MTDRAREYKPGERIPGTVYQVLRTIGAGGMGTVYDVEDTSIGKGYVLKTLHPQLGAREDLARRMQNEARTLARLHHPNIVDVITAGVTGDDLKLPYYVMERLDGKSLRYVLDKGGQLELPHAYHIAIDLCDALDHAHDKGVIHRDVKPDNIFLHRTSAGVTVTKLLDFGILSLLDATNRETAGRFLGTLRYAAPEQLRGDKPTPKMDIYAAALVLFEMVAGRGPFDDEGDPTKVAAAHIHKPAPLLSCFVVVPPELDSLVNAALSKLPEHRPRDAFSFAASLRNLKKALGGPRQVDSTEDRATAPAVVLSHGARSPYVEVRQASPAGPYVVSPAPAQTGSAPPSTPPEAGPLGLPRTTMKGMPSPTVGPALAQPASQTPTMTSADPVDRHAPTGSIVPDTPRIGQHGTAPIAAGPASVATPAAFAPTLPSALPAVPAVASFHWPVEQPAAQSESPQVRTVTGPLPGLPRSKAPVVVAVLAGASMLMLAVVLLVVRAGVSSRAPAAARPQATVVPAVPPPAPQPVVTMPAPTLAPPALDEPAPAMPSASPGASASATRSKAPSLPPRRPSPASNVDSRPGPGF
jgi:eukaryotic-like serine/threonine-protein kinase